MENPSNYLITKICDKFMEFNPQSFEPDVFMNLVRIHNEKQQKNGDVSIPINRKVWQNYCDRIGNKLKENGFGMIEEAANDNGTDQKEFIADGAKWIYPLERIQIRKDVCSFYLQRNAVIARIIQQVLQPAENTIPYGYQTKDPQRRIFIMKKKNNCKDLPQYRADMVSNILKKLLKYSKWTIDTEQPLGPEADKVLHIQVISIASDEYQRLNAENNQQNIVLIKCGRIIDPLTERQTTINIDEYLNLRKNDMQLMGMHKYGMRVKDNAHFRTLVDKLGAAALAVDMVEVKHSSPMRIKRNGQGCTKGASFLLYNSARLETLLRTFENRVENATYQALPNLTEVDLAILNEEEEWQLVFGYIFDFPALIERCLHYLEHGSFAQHLVTRFLTGFVSVFSVYYRRIRILIETRTHLLPVVYARIYLVMTVRKILNMILDLLDIEPMAFM